MRYRKGSGLPINVPALELLEIGAGGGSIARTEMGLIKVGPESAGADPGPACYGRGGRQADGHRRQRRPGLHQSRQFQRRRHAARRAGRRRGDRAASLARPSGSSAGEAAWGIYTMANANMERAMRIVSVERGRDPRRYGLVAFGGAGPLHAAPACARAGHPQGHRAVGRRRRLGHRSARSQYQARSVADAPSCSLTRRRRGRDHRDLSRAGGAVARRSEASAEPAAAGHGALCLPALSGQGHEIRVDLPAFPVGADYVAETSGTVRGGLSAPSTAIGRPGPRSRPWTGTWWPRSPIGPPGAHRAPGWRGGVSRGARRGIRPAYFPELGGYVDTRRLRAGGAGAGEAIAGPAIIEEAEATTVVLPKAVAVVSQRGHLVIAVG